MQQWAVTTTSDEQTRGLGRLLGQTLPASALVLLQGTLGAGKTVFAQGVARGIGISEETPVNSPTYTLLNHYTGVRELFHFDLYRLGDPDELFELGFDEYAHGDGVALVEWPERMADTLFEHLHVEINVIDAQRREVCFSATGEVYQQLLERFVPVAEAM